MIKENFQIVIPMTGYGSRFVAAGYKELKPFIPVLGTSIIEWIVKRMYSGETDFIFVCRKEHIDTMPEMKSDLQRIAPESKIVEIEDWVKKGPVFDVLRSSELIDDDRPTIINYCDFYMSWDWKEFKNAVRERDCDGCVPCYTGFHPHLLPEKNLYASCKTDENDNLVEIREKYSFEENKFKTKHSPGVYYFKSGSLMKEYCQKLVDSGEMLNGEFYASLPYNFMVRDGRKVWIPTNVKYFCQWGTPEDLQEFNFWINMLRGGEQK